MGYTHSWYRDKEISSETMKKITADFSLLTQQLPNGSGITETPDFWGALGDVAFGGEGGTCEPMIFCRVSSGRQIGSDRAEQPWQMGRYFEFCKTERMPYDLAVMGIIVIVKKHAGEAIRVFTDGKNEDWRPAFDLCQRALGYGVEFSIEGRELLASL